MSEMTTPREPWAIVTGDFHIKPKYRIWRTRASPSGDIFCAIQKIVDYAKAHQIATVFLLGDIFDLPVNTSDCLAIMRLFEDFDVYFVQGQHDRSDPPWLSVLNRLNWHHAAGAFSLYGYRLYGIDFVYDPIPVFKSLENVDVVLTHQVWSDVVPGGIISLRDVPDSVSLVLSGDLHCARTLGSKPRLIFPGVPAPTSMAEFGTTGFGVLYKDLSYEYIVVNSRPCYDFGCVASIEQLEQIQQQYPIVLGDELPEALRTPVVRVTVTSPELVAVVQERFRDVHLFVELNTNIAGRTLDRTVSLQSTFTDIRQAICQAFSGNKGNIALRLLDAVNSNTITPNTLATALDLLEKEWEQEESKHASSDVTN